MTTMATITGMMPAMTQAPLTPLLLPPPFPELLPELPPGLFPVPPPLVVALVLAIVHVVVCPAWTTMLEQVFEVCVQLAWLVSVMEYVPSATLSMV